MNINNRAMTQKELYKSLQRKNTYLFELQKSPSPSSRKVQVEVIKRISQRNRTKVKDIPSPSTLHRWHHNWVANGYQFPLVNR